MKRATTTLAALVFVALNPILSAARSPNLCAFDPKKGPFERIENKKALTVAQFLDIDSSKLTVKPWIGKLKDKNGAEAHIRELLNFKPHFLAQFPGWAEGIMLRDDGLLVRLKQKSGKVLIMEAQGKYACVQDANGKYWYFRAVPIDGWPSETK